MKEQALRWIVIGVALAVWAVSMIADLIVEGFQPSPFVHIAGMAVIGWATGTALVKKQGGKNGD